MNPKDLKGKFFKDYFSYGMVEVIGKVARLALLPILTRNLSAEEYGTIDLILAISALLILFNGFGLNASLGRYYNINDGKQGIYSTHLLLNLVGSIFFTLILYPFSSSISILINNNDELTEFIKLGILAAFFGGLANLPLMLLRRQHRVVTFGFINMSDALLYTTLAIYFVVVKDIGLIGIFYAHLFGNVAKFIFSLMLTYKEFVLKIELNQIIRYLKFSIPYFPAAFVGWANYELNRFLIISTLGFSSLGFFGASIRISNIMDFFTRAFKNTWLPLSMEMIQDEVDFAVYRKAAKYYFTLFILLIVIFNFLSPLVIYLVLPKNYFHIYKLIPFITGAYLFRASSGIFNVGAAIVEKTLITSTSSWLGLLVNSSITYFLCQEIGILGAAIGLFLGQFTAQSFQLYNTEKLMKISYDLKYLLHSTVFYSVHSVLIVLIAIYYDNNMGTILLINGVVTIAAVAYYIRFVSGLSFIKDIVLRLKIKLE